MATQSHPMLDPLWRRVLLVVVCAVWAGLELLSGKMFWIVLSAGMTAYGAWLYLIDYKPSTLKD